MCLIHGQHLLLAAVGNPWYHHAIGSAGCGNKLDTVCYPNRHWRIY